MAPWRLSSYALKTRSEGHEPWCRVKAAKFAETRNWACVRLATRRAPYAAARAGTGKAVTDLIFSMAKRDVTFFKATAPINFL